MKILVVDDESIVLESCRRVLEDCFEVISASSADAALEVLRRETIGMILLDIKMPGKRWDVSVERGQGEVAAHPGDRHERLRHPETVEQVSRTEAATFLAKPFTPDELVEVVAKVIEKEGKP